jgi:peptide/nickel transport system permease protein
VQHLLITRLLALIPYLFAVFTIVFVLSRVVPADPVRALIGVSGSQITDEQVQSMKKELGLDKSLPDQYLIYLKQLATLDLGESFRTRRSVLSDLDTRFFATLELTLYTALISTAGGVLLGFAAATTRRRLIDFLARLVAVVGSSAPLFWVALLLQLFFYGRLHLLPPTDRIDSHLGAPTRITGLYTVDAVLTLDWSRLGSAVTHLILPTLTLSLLMIGLTAKMTRTKVLELLGRDFVRTARAKGLPQRNILSRHVLPNFLVPLVHIWGLEFGRLLGGAAAVETVFSFPGIGQYAVDSIIFFDFPAITGITLMASIIFLLTSLLAELISALIDPSLRPS